MTTTKKRITNAAALTALCEWAHTMPDAPAEAIYLMDRHAAILRAQAAKPSTPTKGQMRNAVYLDAVLAHLANDPTPLTRNDVANIVAIAAANANGGAGECSPEKASALMARGVREGSIRRITSGKVVMYALPE